MSNVQCPVSSILLAGLIGRRVDLKPGLSPQDLWTLDFGPLDLWTFGPWTLDLGL